jgi:CelD/BcsL family acetyltransferase involved in cellulose biosynthesis
VFLSAAWIQSWVDIYSADFRGLWVHWEADGRVVAGCLLVERVVWVKYIPFRSLYLNATGHAAEPSPFAEFNEVLHLPGHGEAVAADLARLMHELSWSRLLLCGHERQGTAARLVDTVAGVHTEQVGNAARFVDLTILGDQAFEATLVGKAGTRVRRNRRAFQERLGEITVRRAADLQETLAFFSQMRDLHLMRWNSREKATTLTARAVVAFHHRIIEALFADGGVEMLRVGSADRPVGFLYNFVVYGRVFVFQTGFAYEPGSKWSPGLLTHALAIEHYRSRGMREYDLLSGDALYKRTLCNGVRELFWTVVYRDRIWIRLLLAARRLRNRLVPSQMLSKAP